MCVRLAGSLDFTQEHSLRILLNPFFTPFPKIGLFWETTGTMEIAVLSLKSVFWNNGANMEKRRFDF